MTEVSGPAHDALNRMRRASDRGTGCYLTAEMIQSLRVTMIGQMWSEPDPRAARPLTKAQLRRLAQLPDCGFTTEADLSDLVKAGAVAVTDTYEFKRGELTNTYAVTDAGRAALASLAGDVER